MKEVVVIGGGIIGLSSAWYLAHAGHRVTVLEKGDFTDNCSYGNMGYVCPSHFIPLAAPGIVWKGLKWMFNSNSPFYVQPSLNKALLDWGRKFTLSATKKNVNRAAVPLRDIALLSHREYRSWSQIPGFNFSFEHKGLLEIFRTPKVAAHAKHIYEKAWQLGLEVALLNAGELQTLEPQTEINALGAIHFKCDSHLYPAKLMTGLIIRLREMGATLLASSEVTSFETKNNAVNKVIAGQQAFECDEVIIATGCWSRPLAAMLNTRIPLMPGRGYSFTLEDSPYQLNHPALLVEGRAAITPMDGNKMRFGGTMEIVPTTTPPRHHRVNGIRKAVKDFFPRFDIPQPEPAQVWHGYRPCSADGLPYIGRIKAYRNVVVATGHSMLGLSLGAGTGRLVADLIDDKPPAIDLAPFLPERFK